jgi:signal transduction histidine kinase
MFRSVFWRMVMSQVLVALLAAALAGALSYRLFRNYYESAERERVIRIGRAVADTAAPLLDKGDPRGQIGTIARAAGAAVDGRVCIFGRTEHELLAASAEGEGAELDAKPAITEVFADEVRVERTSAQCEPRHLLKVTVPINSARGPLGSVMVRVPVEGTEAILRSVRRLSLLTAACAGAVAVLLSLAVSRTIASPLRRISRTASRIGAGEFAARVERMPGGEIGELAATVNHMARQLEAMFDQLAREKTILEENIEQARRLEQMRRNFVANASHQLRTPLTGARGFLEALTDGTASTPEARWRCAEVALQQLARMQALIDKLMDLSRFDAGAVELECEPVRVPELLEGAVLAFEPRLREAQLHLETHADPDLPEITADGARLIEALGNLLDNAIRFSPGGGGIVLAATQEGDRVRFTVRDEGPGVPEEDLESVWERFTTRAPAGASEGMGLGLAIVREIVLAHGGEVFAHNAPEGGAVFGLTLPTS